MATSLSSIQSQMDAKDCCLAKSGTDSVTSKVNDTDSGNSKTDCVTSKVNKTDSGNSREDAVQGKDEKY